jgi:CRISPR/Cas system-associated exonuclease Cas4 (RecB family)
MNNARTTEELLQTISVSRLNTFHTCRLQFFFRYVAGIKSPNTAARYVGITVHHALSIWNRARWRKQALSTEGLQEQFNEFWVKEETAVRWDDGEAEVTKTQAWSLLETYLKNTPIPPNEAAEGVEVSVEADLESHGLPKLVGILDLIRPGGLIVDFKTAGQTPNADKAEHLHESQLSAYGILYREATGRKERGFELHHLVKLKTPKLVVTELAPMTERQKTRLFRLIESYVQGVEREDWVPSPHPMTCSCCEFIGHCRRWS